MEPAAAAGYQRVGGRALGITFEIPLDWHQDPLEEVWRPSAGVAPVALGVSNHSGPGLPEDQALLPNHGTLVDRRPVNLGWASGTRYTVEISAPAQAGGQPLMREVHTIVRLGGKAIYDLYSAAAISDRPAMAAAEQHYEHLLTTIHLVGG